MANPSPTTMYLNGVTVDSSLNTVQLGNFSLSAGRSTFTAVNERHAVGAKYSSIGGSVYFGAVDASGNPDAQISRADGDALMTLKNTHLNQQKYL